MSKEEPLTAEGILYNSSASISPDRIAQYTDFPLETTRLSGVEHSHPIEFLLRQLYAIEARRVEESSLRGRKRAGQREMMSPLVVPKFTRERDGELREYSNLLFAGTDRSRNGYYVFTTEPDPDDPQPRKNDDFLVFKCDADGRITEPIVGDVEGSRIALYDPRFNTHLDKTPAFENKYESVTAEQYREMRRNSKTPSGYRRIDLSWAEDPQGVVENPVAYIYSEGGLNRVRERIYQPDDQTMYDIERSRPEKSEAVKRTVDKILKPGNEKLHHALSGFFHDFVGDLRQSVRDRSSPPPGGVFGETVAIGFAPETEDQNGVAVAIGTLNEQANSNRSSDYSVAVIDLATGQQSRVRVDWAWQEKDGRVWLEMGDFNGQGRAYISWMVGETGAGYDVSIKREYSGPSRKLRVIDDLDRAIKKGTGGLSVAEMVEFDKAHHEAKSVDRLADRILTDPVAHKAIDEMLRQYIGVNVETGATEGSELPELLRTRQGSDELVSYGYSVETFVNGAEVHCIRSTRGDGRGNPQDYLVTVCDTETGRIEELTASWVWPDGTRFHIGYQDPHTLQNVQVSCLMEGDDLLPDSWLHDGSGGALPPFNNLLKVIYDQANGHEGFVERRAVVLERVGATAVSAELFKEPTDEEIERFVGGGLEVVA